MMEAANEKGIKHCSRKKDALENRLLSSPELKCWDVAMLAKMV
jgi:hypothetical protein